MTLKHELDNLSAQELADTYDCVVEAPADDRTQLFLRLQDEHSNLVALLDHATEAFAQQHVIALTDRNLADNLHLRAFQTGALTVLCTLAQSADSQEFKEQLGL